MTIAGAKDDGMTLLRTYNHSANQGILAVNAKFGYRATPGWLLFRHRLS